jgi:hypothetical protein
MTDLPLLDGPAKSFGNGRSAGNVCPRQHDREFLATDAGGKIAGAMDAFGDDRADCRQALIAVRMA